MKRIFAQSALWSIALSMLCLPMTASASPQDQQTSSMVSPKGASVQGDNGRCGRRHKRWGQGQVAQNPSPNPQMPDGGNGRPSGGWMDRKNGGKELTPEERRARMERLRARQNQRQGMENGTGQGPAGGRKISDEERQARRERRRERQGQGMENRPGQGTGGGRKVSDEERKARQEQRRQRQGMENRPGQAPRDSNESPRPVESND